MRRRRRLAAPTLAAVVVAGLVGVAGCGGSDGGAGGDAVTTTTRSPLEEVALDACGNDLSALRSTVWAVDARTGEVRWSAELPLAEHYLLRAESGNPLVPLQRRSVEVELDLATGAVVGYPPAGAHEVLEDVTTGVLHVDGEPQPDRPEVGGVIVEATVPAPAEPVEGVGPALVASDGSVVVWSVDLWHRALADGASQLSRPVAYGDTVVIVASASQPPLTCLSGG